MRRDIIQMNNLKNVSPVTEYDSIPEEAIKGIDELCNSSDDSYIKENIIIIDKINNGDFSFNKEKFQNGIDCISELCGKITALVNVGLTPTAALNYIASKEDRNDTLGYMLEAAKINSNTVIESSKYESINTQKNIL